MSGTKTATVDLNEVAKAELERILNDARTNASVLASLSNLLGQLQSLQKEIEHFLGLPRISEGFRERMQTFQKLIVRFVALFNQLRSKLDQLKQLNQSSNAITARNEATKLQQEIARLTSELQAVAAEAKDQLQGVEASIAAESQTGKYLEQQVDRQLRLELNGLLEELKIRLHPATSLNFQGVGERANSLLQRIEKACRSKTPVLETEVRECQKQFSDLAREVEEEEKARQKSWAIFNKLDTAFKDAGFYLADPVNPPERHTPIRAHHAISDDQFKASVSTRLYNESLTLEMRGDSGEDSGVLGKDQLCPANLGRIIAKALRCGLTITNVMVKDPNDPSGWSAMDLPSHEYEQENEHEHEHGTTTAGTAHGQQQQMQVLPK